jgi:hypothetical protein
MVVKKSNVLAIARIGDEAGNQARPVGADRPANGRIGQFRQRFGTGLYVIFMRHMGLLLLFAKGVKNKMQPGLKRVRPAHKIRFAMVFFSRRAMFFVGATFNFSIAAAPFCVRQSRDVIFLRSAAGGRRGGDGLFDGWMGDGKQSAEQHGHVAGADAGWLSVGGHL